MDELNKQRHTDTPIFTEVGTTGLKRQGGLVYEDFLPYLRWPQASKIYQEMESNDPVVGAILYVCEQLLRKVRWKVQAASSSKLDQDLAAFVTECMDDMEATWNDTITEILSMLPYGFAWHEEVYKIRDGWQNNPKRRSKFSDGLIGWRKLAGRAQVTIESWVFDEKVNDGGILAAHQVAPPDFRPRVIPFEKSLLFRVRYRYNNPEGRSLLRNAYRPWYFKKHIEEIEGIGIERDLAGLPVLRTPEGVDIWDRTDPEATAMRNQAEQLIRNIRRDQNEGVILPFGWELQLLSTGSRRQFDTNAIINRYDQRISSTLLADIVMLGADKVGSFALASVKKGLLGVSLDAIADSIAEVLNNYAIPRLIRLNPFPPVTKYPRLVPTTVVAPELNEVARYIQSLAGAKMPLFPDENLEEYFRQMIGMPSLEAMTEEQRAQQLTFLEETIINRGPGGPNLNMSPTDGRSSNEGIPQNIR